MPLSVYVPSKVSEGYFADVAAPGISQDGKVLAWNNSAGVFDWAIASVHTHQDAASGGQIDHGSGLTGLLDDDHTQYLLATGARTGASGQAQTFTNGSVLGAEKSLSLDTTGGWNFAIHSGGSTYNGTRDDVLFIRYNWLDGSVPDSAEHMFGHALESNFDNGSVNAIEWNFDHQKPGVGRVFRYLAFYQDRASATESTAQWALVGEELKLYNNTLGSTEPSFDFETDTNQYTAKFSFANTDAQTTSEFSITASGAANQARYWRYGAAGELVIDANNNTLGINTGAAAHTAQFEVTGSESVIANMASTSSSDVTATKFSMSAGADGNYIAFGRSTIGGNNDNAQLRYTRTSGHQMDFSVYTQNTSGTGVEVLSIAYNLVQVNADINTDRWTSTSNNVALGADVFGAGNLNHTTDDTGWYNVGIGSSACRALTTGYQNLGIGFASLFNATASAFNVGVGANTLFAVTTAGYNTAIGGYALNVATGAQNTGVGWGALSGVTSGQNNAGFGYLAGDNITTGSDNIVIGATADAPSATASNQLVIGGYITGDGASLTLKPRTAGQSLNLAASSDKMGFHGATAVAKQTVTGSRSGNAALADLLTKLANLGIITDSTT